MGGVVRAGGVGGAGGVDDAANAVPTALNVPLTFWPSKRTEETMISAISEAMSAYSIEVTPRRSVWNDRNFIKIN